MVRLYRDVLGFKVIEEDNDGANVAFEFGSMTLWLDSVPTITQAEIWLEINADDLPAAQKTLVDAGCTVRPEVEPLPENLDAFWISTPSNLIHLVSRKAE